MKTTLLILSLFVGLFTYAQKSNNIKIEKQGELYQVTLFHNNGEVAQTGFITEDKKLHGIWTMFDHKGQKVSRGFYKDGKKTGRWFLWNKNSEAITQIDFSSDFRVKSAVKKQLNTQLADNDIEE